MFWIQRKNNPIQQDIQSFALARKQFRTTNNQVSYINQFIRSAGIEKFEQISEYEINIYISSLRSSVVRESERIQMAQSLFLFLHYKKLSERRKNKRSRGRPAKVERNEELLLLRKQKYTYRDLAEKFKLDVRTVYDIINRKSKD